MGLLNLLLGHVYRLAVSEMARRVLSRFFLPRKTLGQGDSRGLFRCQFHSPERPVAGPCAMRVCREIAVHFFER